MAKTSRRHDSRGISRYFFLPRCSEIECRWCSHLQLVPAKEPEESRNTRTCSHDLTDRFKLSQIRVDVARKRVTTVLAWIGLAFFGAGCPSATPLMTQNNQLKRITHELGNDLRTFKNGVLASEYSETECVDVFLKRAKEKAGLICTTRNREFIREMGITEYRASAERS